MGCEDMIELEKQSYVIAVGIDETEQEGIFLFTFQIANPEVGSIASSVGSEQEASETVTIRGTDIMTATTTANAFVTKQIALDQTRVIIASESLARSDQFIRIIQSAGRTPQIRKSVQLIISQEDAATFIKNNQPTLEQRPHKYYQYMLTRAKETGIIPDADLHRFFQITEGDADLFLAMYATTNTDPKIDRGSEDNFYAGQIPKSGGNPTQFMGSAVFKEGIMIDRLTGEETRIANILDKTMEMSELLTTYPDPLAPKYRVAADYIQSQEPIIDIQYDAERNHATINVLVQFEIEILAIPSLVNYSQSEADKATLEKSIEDYNEAITKELIKKTQESYRAQPFYWSLYARKHFKDIPAFEQADWNKNIYPNADIHVSYQLKKMQFGNLLDDTNLNEVRD